MIIAKNPQLKTEANNIKSMMLKHAYIEEKQIKITGYDYYRGKFIEKSVESNVVVYKTDRGEYKHPIDMNAEMARRFELLERFSSISNGESKPKDSRALMLQGMYAEFKSKPKSDVKKRMQYLKSNLADQEQYMGGKKGHDVLGYDELYVIETLLNII